MSDSRDLPEHAGFAVHLRQGRLSFPFCTTCDRFHWYPKPLCPHCRSAAIEWRAIAGPGEIFSYTVVRHAFDETWKSELPYVVALVTFADAPGVRLVTNVVDVVPDLVGIGAAVEPIFPDADDAETRVQFRLAKLPSSIPVRNCRPTCSGLSR